MKTTKAQLTEADYDFSNVPANELVACHWYEYARESKAVRDEITAARKKYAQNKKIGKNEVWLVNPGITTLMQRDFLSRLVTSTGFPNTPWLNLSEIDRRVMLKFFASFPRTERYYKYWNDEPLNFSWNESGETTLDSWKTKKEKFPFRPATSTDRILTGFFSVNLKHSRRVLMEEFLGWLNTFEGKPYSEAPLDLEKPEKKPAGRKSKWDELNALGAMRLRYHCKSFSETQKFLVTLKNEPHGMSYGRRDSFNRACDSAVTIFRNQWGWLDSSPPIHYTQGWKKGD